MSRKRWFQRPNRPGGATTVACIGAAALAAGCGAPSDSNKGKSGSVKVGIVVPTSGTVAAAGGDMLDGWRLWFKQHGDKVAGRKIETTSEDSAGDPTVTLTKARKLVQQNAVQVLVGPLLANEAYAINGFLEKNPKVIGLNPSGSSDDLSQRARQKNYVRAGGWQSSTGAHVAGEWAAHQGWKRAITLCSDYAFGYENCGGFTNTFTDRGGKVVKQLYNPLGTSDYSSFLSQIDPGSVDGVFVESVGADSPKFISAWNDLGLKQKVPLIASETTFEQSTLRGVVGDDPVGMKSFGHYAEGRSDPATQDFVKAYKKAYGKTPGYYSCATYTAAQWLTQAIKNLKGDVSDTDKFLKALNAVALDDSCFGPMSLDSHGGTVGNQYLRQVRRRNGKLVNEVVKTYPNVSQFWNYKPEEFLKQPVYSRKYQGKDWPTSCGAYARACPLKAGS